MGRSALSYKSSGVDIAANTTWVRRIRSAMARTHGPAVVGRQGAFAGMYRLDAAATPGRGTRHPLLVGCADGVGTKVLLGIKTGRLRGLGIDLVAMNVNDLITCGAEPLFFLDYLAVNKLDPDALLELIEGVADGCGQAGCALLGGETAEMPDLYRRGDFDLAGFAVGVVASGREIDGGRVAPGDVIIGLPSSGVHSNGFSLVRKVIAANRLKLDRVYDDLGESAADALLEPTRIYVRDVLALVDAYRSKSAVTGMAHITGGGLAENIERAISADCDAVIDTTSWSPPPVFPFLQRHGVRRREMFKVFNMGIGYCFIVRPRFANGAMRRLEERGAGPVIIGRVKRGAGKVTLT